MSEIIQVTLGTIAIIALAAAIVWLSEWVARRL